MLGKKSLAIALMGLGLAGSCFAAQNAVTVNFSANVVAATCPFSVTAGGETEVKFENVPWSLENFPEKTMTFTLNCSQGVPFNAVSIKATTNGGEKVTSNKGAYFAFYNTDDDEPWDSSDDDQAITFTGTPNGAGATFTDTKLVRFEMTNETVVGEGHSASVTYTATYE